MDVPSHDEVVELIDTFLSRHDMAPSRFGRDAFGEPQFVSSVRNGRTPGLSTLRKMRKFMCERDEAKVRENMSSVDSGGVRSDHRISAGSR